MPHTDKARRWNRAPAARVALTGMLAGVSTLLLALALFALALSQGAEMEAQVITGYVLLTGLTGCFAGWKAVDAATERRAVATWLFAFVALAADAVTLVLVLDWAPTVT